MLGIDVGARRIGIALSDSECRLATAHVVIDTRRGNAIDAIGALAREAEVETAVLGLPLSLDGGEGPSAARARGFGEELARRTGLKVVYQDERYSTASAAEVLEEAGVPPKKRKGMIDKVAAQIILQCYLDLRRADPP